MTIIKIYKILSKTKNNKLRNKEILEVRCDNCETIFNYKGKSSRGKNSALHFCDKKCSNESFSNGKLRAATVKTQINKYGSIYVSTNDFSKKQKLTFLEKYGVESIMNLPEVRKKIENTFQKKYGSKSYAGTDDHKSKCDFKAIAQKAWQTKIKNGSCSKSAPEDRMHEILFNFYGIDNIKRQVPMIRQWVDFYVESANFYLQIDGVYWHGLNRPIKQIKLGKTRQDQDIYKQILRDKKLNYHMKKNNLKLIRVTDEEMRAKTNDEIINLVEEKLHASLPL